MTDHLGNVLATVLDRKTGAGTLSGSSGTLYDHWSADLASTADYYPGGMMMPGRNTEYSWSRMGSQSQQKDDEVYGKGNTYAYKYRMNDARINRFFSPDPLHFKYPHNSDYAFSENRLIDGVELEGLEWENLMSKFSKPGELAIKYPDAKTAQTQFYCTYIENPKVSFTDIKSKFKNAPQNILTNSKAEFHSPVDAEGKTTQFKVGSYIEIDIDGPLNNGFVKVIGLTETDERISATFATMEGHLEKGVINFAISKKGEDGYTFSITGTSNVDMGMAPEGFSRSEQRDSWREVLTKFVETTGGKEVNRVEKTVDPQ